MATPTGTNTRKLVSAKRMTILPPGRSTVFAERMGVVSTPHPPA